MSKLTPVILIVFSVLIFFAFIDPQRAEITALREEKAEYEEVLAKAKDLLELRDELLKKYTSVSDEDKERIQLMLPDNVDNVRLVLDIDQLAQNKKIALKNITVNSGKQLAEQKPDAGTPSGNIGVATVGFSVNTTYELFLDFLRELEDSLRIIDVTGLTIAPAEKGFNYSIVLRTYWLK